MPVYVDDAKHTYGRMIMCHMLADTPEELHAMADRIGVKRKWCQNEGTWREHYDICRQKRRIAVEVGAIEVTERWMAHFHWERRPNKEER